LIRGASIAANMPRNALFCFRLREFAVRRITQQVGQPRPAGPRPDRAARPADAKEFWNKDEEPIFEVHSCFHCLIYCAPPSGGEAGPPPVPIGDETSE
jgi:hypothetical protein